MGKPLVVIGFQLRAIDYTGNKATPKTPTKVDYEWLAAPWVNMQS